MSNANSNQISVKNELLKNNREKQPYRKWTDEEKESIALYLRDNFDSYRKIGANGGKKTQFLAKMKSTLEFICTQHAGTQLLNAFDAIIRKYKTVKEKLESTGFGIDPETDKSIEEGYLRKQCSYFIILDEVMGQRPNIAPPHIIQSEAADDEAEFELQLLDQDSNSVDQIFDLPSIESELAKDTAVKGQTAKGKKRNYEAGGSLEVTNMVQKTFSKLGVQPITDKGTISKNPMAVFVKVLSDKICDGNATEEKKLKLDREKFEYEVSKEGKAQQHELTKIKMQQDFELEKLKLQIELAKIQKN